jgi:uncharacterized RDD family membrane protein YckC
MSELHGGSGAPERAVLGLDNVPLELPVASVGNRVLAAFLDHLLLGLLSLAVSVVTVAAATVLKTGFGWGLALWVVAMFLLNTGYFALLEVALSGQTPGKRALKLRVVSRDGGAPSPGALVVRNLFRIIDNLIGVVLIAVDPLARRLGDRLAGTLVVHAVEARTEVVATRVPDGWGPRQVAAVEAFLDRFEVLEPERSRALARRILIWIERDDPGFLALVPPSTDPVARVLRAFRGAAQKPHDGAGAGSGDAMLASPGDQTG